MKKIRWLLVGFGVCFLAICQAQTDTLSYYFFKENQLALLNSDATVAAFKVHDFKAVPEEVSKLEEFRILEKKELTAEQIAYIKQTLVAPQNYFFTSKLKQCMFLPQYGLQVVSANDTMNILLSFSCETIRFYDENGFQLINLHLGAKPFSDFFSEVFPMPIVTPEIGPLPPNEELANMSFELMQGCTEKGVFQTKMSQPEPIHYIISEGDSPNKLAQKVQTECDLSVPIEKLLELNNLTITELEKLKPGDAIVIGYSLQ